MNYCEHCGKVLKVIGTDRKNGRLFTTIQSQENHFNSDWENRKYHKSCWKKKKEKQKLMMQINGHLPF